MLLTLKDQSNNPVIVNSGHILYISQAADASTKAPLLGFSVVFMHLMIPNQGPFALLVKGAPEEVKAQIESQESYGTSAIQ